MPEKPRWAQRIIEIGLTGLLAVGIVRVLGGGRGSPVELPGDSMRRRPGRRGSAVWAAAGAVFVLGVVFIRAADGRSPFVGGSALDDNTVAVFGDLWAIERRPNTEAYGNIPDLLPPIRYRLELAPAPTEERPSRWRGEFSLVVLDGSTRLGQPAWSLEIRLQTSLIFLLPPGAEMSRASGDRHLIESSLGPRACAAWTPDDDGPTHIEYASVLVPEEHDGVFLVCPISRVGGVSELRVEVPFFWDNQNTRSAGISRTRTAIRVEGGPDDRGRRQEPLDLFVFSPRGQRITEAFPDPASGGVGSRTWPLDSAEGIEIEVTLEQPGSRWWIQPALDLLILSAGSAFAIAVSIWFLGGRRVGGEPTRHTHPPSFPDDP